MSCKHHMVFDGKLFEREIWRCKICGKEYLTMYVVHKDQRVEMWWDEETKKFLIRNSEKQFETASEAINYITSGEYEEEAGG